MIAASFSKSASAISEKFTSLNPYNFTGTILKVEDVNHVDNDPTKPLRVVHGYAISGKR
jgi:hypothetical protein